MPPRKKDGSTGQNGGDMVIHNGAHQCRYCQHLVTGNGIYCTEKNEVLPEKYTKNPNRCKAWEFNPMDAYGETDGYKPRQSGSKRIDGQMSLSDLEV